MQFLETILIRRLNPSSSSIALSLGVLVEGLLLRGQGRCPSVCGRRGLFQLRPQPGLLGVHGWSDPGLRGGQRALLALDLAAAPDVLVLRPGHRRLLRRVRLPPRQQLSHLLHGCCRKPGRRGLTVGQGLPVGPEGPVLAPGACVVGRRAHQELPGPPRGPVQQPHGHVLGFRVRPEAFVLKDKYFHVSTH